MDNKILDRFAEATQLTPEQEAELELLIEELGLEIVSSNVQGE